MVWVFVVLVNLVGLAAVSWGNSTNTSVPEEQFQNAMQVVTTHCYSSYSPGCAQFDFLTQLERLLTTTEYEVLPGVFLSRHNSTDLSLPPELTDLEGRELDTTTNTLNSFLAEQLFQQLRTWSLSVYVFGNNTLQQLRSVMDMYLNYNQEVETGRRAKYWKFMGGALLTVAFSVISALVSKSLTMSIIALALTVLGGRGSGNSNFGFGPAAAPAVAFRSPPPVRSHLSQTSEVQYVDELPDDAGQPYVYVNRRAWRVARGEGEDDYGKYINKY